MVIKKSQEIRTSVSATRELEFFFDSIEHDKQEIDIWLGQNICMHSGFVSLIEQAFDSFKDLYQVDMHSKDGSITHFKLSIDA